LPLQSRECLGLGLPLALAYQDTDLGAASYDFLLRIPNKEDNIQTHGQAIHEFAQRMRGRRADRAILEKCISSTYKEEQRLEFFNEILQKA